MNEYEGREPREFEVKVPDVGEGVAEVELVSWAVEPGQRVTRHQIIAEVMTDKATVEVPSPVEGVIAVLSGEPGDILLVGSTLFTLDLEGAEAPTGIEVEPRPVTTAPGAGAGLIGTPTRNHRPTADAATAAGAAPPPRPTAPGGRPTAAPVTAGTTTAPPAAPTAGRDAGLPPSTALPPRARDAGPARTEGRRPTASPAVRRRARDAGLDLRVVPGSGPAGRITHEDLDALFAGTVQPVAATNGHGARLPDTTVTDQPLIGVRRKIAERMVAATTTIPHITYVEEVDVTALEELRQTLNANPPAADGAASPRLTLLPFLIRALVRVLPDFPVMNAHLIEDAAALEPDQPSVLRTFGGVHVGIATQTDAGLVVPVVRHAEAESLWSTAARIAALAQAARAGTVAPADLSGSTITITSLGPLGGLITTPVINKPEVAIVGVNKIATRPLWDGRDFVPRKVMNLSSSFDHRVIDGWDAARFVLALKRVLEQPALLFVDHE